MCRCCTEKNFDFAQRVDVAPRLGTHAEQTCGHSKHPRQPATPRVDARDGVHKRMKQYTVFASHQASLVALTNEGELPSFDPVFLALAKMLHPTLARCAARKYAVRHASDGATAEAKALQSAGLVTTTTTAVLGKPKRKPKANAGPKPMPHAHPRVESPQSRHRFPMSISGLRAHRRQRRRWERQRQEHRQRQQQPQSQSWRTEYPELWACLQTEFLAQRDGVDAQATRAAATATATTTHWALQEESFSDSSVDVDISSLWPDGDDTDSDDDSSIDVSDARWRRSEEDDVCRSASPSTSVHTTAML